jgi:hypothetical protein
MWNRVMGRSWNSFGVNTKKTFIAINRVLRACQSFYITVTKYTRETIKRKMD